MDEGAPELDNEQDLDDAAEADLDLSDDAPVAEG